MKVSPGEMGDFRIDRRLPRSGEMIGDFIVRVMFHTNTSNIVQYTIALDKNQSPM